MTNQGRTIRDEELVEIAGGFEQPIIGIDDDPGNPLDRVSGGVPRRPGGGTTNPVEPVGGGGAGSSSDLA